MNQGLKFAQSSAVYFNYTLEYAIKSLSSLGYDGIEIWGGRPHAYRDDLLEEIAKLRSLIQNSGLEVCNFIPAQFRYPTLLCSENERVRQDSVGIHCGCVTECLPFRLSLYKFVSRDGPMGFGLETRSKENLCKA